MTADEGNPMGAPPLDAALKAAIELHQLAARVEQDAGADEALRARLADPETRRPALMLLASMPTRRSLAVAGQLLEASESHRDAVIARELLGRVRRDELERTIAPLILARLHDADDDAFRRLAELVRHLGLDDTLAELRVRAERSENPAIREVADDFE